MNVPWSVSVEVAGERILTLCSDGSMAGIDDIQEEDDCVIQLAGEALLAFVNKPVWFPPEGVNHEDRRPSPGA